MTLGPLTVPFSSALPALAALTALSALLVLASPPAQAIGRLADVTIVDRDTGATLPVHYAHGEYWVAGRPGARYAITVRNRLGERLLAVPSVDGVNVLSGETAAWSQAGYVFSPRERYQINGWRKSTTEVAAFEFSHIADSYAARTGRPTHVGVIGVALFREQPAPAVSPGRHDVPRDAGSRLGNANEGASAERSERLREERAAPLPTPPAAAAPAPQAAESTARSMAGDSRAKAAPLPAPQLGTAHGQRETSVVSHTSFERLQERPNEVIRIRYDSRENLVAAGVLREPLAPQPVPRAFPQSDALSYVPDPR